MKTPDTFSNDATHCLKGLFQLQREKVLRILMLFLAHVRHTRMDEEKSNFMYIYIVFLLQANYCSF